MLEHLNRQNSIEPTFVKSVVSLGGIPILGEVIVLDIPGNDREIM